MSPPPKGWTPTPLRNVCELINGRAYKQGELLESGKYRVLRVGNFFSSKSWYYSDLELSADKYCDEGDLLYAWSASFGPRIWDGGKTIFHYHIWKVRCNIKALDKSFLYHWFEWDKRKIQADHGTGSTMIHVTKGDMEARSLDLPPLPEQRRIVAKIKSLLAKSKRARDRLDHVPRLVERYKQAILDASIGTSVRTAPLIEFVEPERGITYGIVQTGIGMLEGVPTVRCGDIKDFTVLRSALKRVEPEIEAKYTRTRLRGGEVLIAIRGSVGNTCVANTELTDCNISREVAMIPVLKEHVPAFFAFYLASSMARSFIAGNVRGVAQQGINLADLRNVPIPLLNPAKQREIVSRIEAAFTWIDRLAAEASSACKLIDRLDQAVLSKAFQGELVQQDPTDEPASVLLKRIEAARDGTEPVVKRRGRPRQAASL